MRYQVSSLRKLVERLPSTHQSTLSHLMKHLQKLATYHQVTGMTSRNLAIVWAPNLLRPQPDTPDCLRDCGLQALVVEALIVYCEEIFTAEGAEDVCVTRRNFTKEVSIDQAVERAESFKPRPGPPERRMVRSISCVSNIRLHTDRDRPALFQGRGVMLRRDRSLTGETTSPTSPVRRQVTSQSVSQSGGLKPLLCCSYQSQVQPGRGKKNVLIIRAPIMGMNYGAQEL